MSIVLQLSSWTDLSWHLHIIVYIWFIIWKQSDYGVWETSKCQVKPRHDIKFVNKKIDIQSTWTKLEQGGETKTINIERQSLTEHKDEQQGHIDDDLGWSGRVNRFWYIFDTCCISMCNGKTPVKVVIKTYISIANFRRHVSGLASTRYVIRS